MPLYDRACPSCGWRRDDCYETRTMTLACPTCGVETIRVWDSPRSAIIHGDDPFLGGQTFENLGHEPVTVYSRSQYRRELAARGLQEFVRHQPRPGTDKSPHTTRWI